MTKYCTLPGQEPVRLDSLDGHIIIIGETPRNIDELFVLKARAAGCLTEEELEALKSRLLGDTAHAAGESLTGDQTGVAGSISDASDSPTTTTITDPAVIPPLFINQDSDKDGFGFAPPSARPAPAAATNERSDQIKAAVIELVNTGNASDLTSSGAPKVEVLKELCGFDVTAQERDAAYEAAKG